jgi:hypothetical protein
VPDAPEPAQQPAAPIDLEDTRESLLAALTAGNSDEVIER